MGSRRVFVPATAIAVAAAAAYAVSPMAVWAGVGLVLVLAWSLSGLEPSERRWLIGILAVAIAARVIVMTAMFFYVSHPHLFSRELAVEGTENAFFSVFGDESYAKRRSLWMRDVWLGLPIAPENYLRAFEPYGWTGYFDVLAILQVWFGPMPFGAHLMNAVLYLAGSVALYRAARTTYGSGAALVGLALVLGLPTLFVWSISAMKEPVHFFLGAMAIYLSVRASRSGSIAGRVCAGLSGGLAAVALGTIRPGTTQIFLAAVVVAGAGLMFLRWPGRMTPALLVAAMVGIAVLAVPSVTHRAMRVAQVAAHRHVGMVKDPGIAYRLLDDRFYGDQDLTVTMTAGDAATFVVKAIVSFVVVPLPGQVGLGTQLALLGPQIIWWASLIVIPWGIVTGLRKDPFLTLLLVGYGGFSAITIAVISGNIGTLIRHRDIVVPFLSWVSALGIVSVAGRWAVRRQESV